VPKVDSVHIDITYATRLFHRDVADLDGDSAVVFAPTPPHDARLAFMLAVERGRWMVTLGGLRGERPPTDLAGFLAFVRLLPRPDIYNVIRHAIPMGEVVGFGFTDSRRPRYERLRRFPERYVILGDALCSFNPVYGEGMSVAALEALAPRQCLAESASLEHLWQRLRPHLAGIVNPAWRLSVQSDLAYPGVVGPRRILAGAANWYLTKVHQAASTDRTVCRTFFDVANLLVPPTALVHPRIVARVARHAYAGDRPAATPQRQ